MFGVVGIASVAVAVALTCWPDRFRVAAQTAELAGGLLLVLGLMLIGVGLSSYFR